MHHTITPQVQSYVTCASGHHLKPMTLTASRPHVQSYVTWTAGHHLRPCELNASDHHTSCSALCHMHKWTSLETIWIKCIRPSHFMFSLMSHAQMDITRDPLSSLQHSIILNDYSYVTCTTDHRLKYFYIPSSHNYPAWETSQINLNAEHPFGFTVFVYTNAAWLGKFQTSLLIGFYWHQIFPLSLLRCCLSLH